MDTSTVILQVAAVLIAARIMGEAAYYEGLAEQWWQRKVISVRCTGSMDSAFDTLTAAATPTVVFNLIDTTPMRQLEMQSLDAYNYQD